MDKDHSEITVNTEEEAQEEQSRTPTGGKTRPASALSTDKEKESGDEEVVAVSPHGGKSRPGKRSREDDENGEHDSKETDHSAGSRKPVNAKAGDSKGVNGEMPLPMLRELQHQRAEAAGTVKFQLVQNDGHPENMVTLVTLKNIFAKQLPKMPKEYIVRLVLDRQHKSMVCINEGEVVGGITYRPHGTQNFAEIAFCAVIASQQVKGFGTRLMNNLKQHVKKENIEYFLTYADNYAIGYFKKQGFQRQVSMKRERWLGYIKDYDGGTLMECPIHVNIDYTNIPKLIEMQRKAILEKMKEISKSHVIHPGLEEGHWNDAENGSNTPKPLSAEDIPGIEETSWRPKRIRTQINKEEVPLRQCLQQLLKELKEHEDAWPFQKPVDSAEAPDYYDVIKDPIDLSLISQRLQQGTYYQTTDQFAADINRMCDNCRQYNGEGNIYFECAERLETFSNEKLKNVVVIEEEEPETTEV